MVVQGDVSCQCWQDSWFDRLEGVSGPPQVHHRRPTLMFCTLTADLLQAGAETEECRRICCIPEWRSSGASARPEQEFVDWIRLIFEITSKSHFYRFAFMCWCFINFSWRQSFMWCFYVAFAFMFVALLMFLFNKVSLLLFSACLLRFCSSVLF